MPSLAALYFTDLVCSGIFFGTYTVLTFSALYLLGKRKRSVVNAFLVVMTIAMYGISTAYFAIEVAIIGAAFLQAVDGHTVRSTFIDIGGPSVAAQISLQGINSALGDSIVIWRAWVVWDRKWPIVFAPLVLLAGNAFSAFGMAYTQSRAQESRSWHRAFQKFMIAFPVLTLATNVVATSLILWRIWSYHRTMKSLDEAGVVVQRSAPYRRLLLILIESGGLYCVTWLVLLCLILTGSPTSHVFLGIISQLTGIYPTLIIVLVSLNLTQDKNVSNPSATTHSIPHDLKFGPTTLGMRSVNVALSTRHSECVSVGF